MSSGKSNGKTRGKKRCAWAGDLPLYQAYHDTEWGVPVRDDRTLFEFVLLEGAQAGLSWITVLKKRENYRRAFAEFDVKKVAGFGEARVEALLKDTGIIRNRLKILSAINNANRFMEMQAEFGGFSAYIWDFVGGQPIINAWKSMDEVPATTPVSDAMSKDLVKRGFKFMGSTICYAHMQAVGLVNDHITGCFRHRELS